MVIIIFYVDLVQETRAWYCTVVPRPRRLAQTEAIQALKASIHLSITITPFYQPDGKAQTDFEGIEGITAFETPTERQP